MSYQLYVVTTLALFSTVAVQAQTSVPEGPAQQRTVPIYQVTVIERTVKAVNYQYRSGPTRIDFQGTVLMPKAKGQATVESKTGRVEPSPKPQIMRSSAVGKVRFVADAY